ncbi:hypothetical protein niasHT_030739 [Heterodera trifolii]|uniref:Thioredoxin domain-containing protein n=1 Tax=Heterodera trifolii TaxID=157864 RepID=A0ABD2I5N4_9BILA
MRRRPFLSVFILFLSLYFTPILAHTDNENAEEAESSNKVEPERPKSDGEGETSKDPSGGFGTDIEWVPWDQAVSVALDLNRPIFLLIHKTWCGACDALKKSFATSPKRKELLELSKQFVMVNTEDEEEPEEEEYAPDGRYIPRLFILNKHGKRLPVDNKKNYPSNVAYFPQVPDVIRAMKEGTEEFKKEQKGTERTEEGENMEEEEKKGKEDKTEKESKKKKTDAESVAEKKSTKSDKKTKKEEPKAEDEVGKGGCPHAAGKAAAKRKKEEEEKKKQAAAKSTEKRETAEKKTDEGKEKSKEKKETVEKKTDEKKAEQQKKKKGAEKEKGEL